MIVNFFFLLIMLLVGVAINVRLGIQWQPGALNDVL